MNATQTEFEPTFIETVRDTEDAVRAALDNVRREILLALTATGILKPSVQVRLRADLDIDGSMPAFVDVTFGQADGLLFHLTYEESGDINAGMVDLTEPESAALRLREIAAAIERQAPKFGRHLGDLIERTRGSRSTHGLSVRVGPQEWWLVCQG